MPSTDAQEVLTRLGSQLHVRFKDRRVLITGARGFLGRAFLEVLAQLPCSVTAVDKFSLAAEMGAGQPVQHDNITWVDFDVARPWPDFSGRLDFILSLAAIASPYHYAKHPMACFDVIVEGTRHALALAARSGATVLLPSTSELYGDPIVVPTPEHALGRLDPWSVRGRAYDVPKLAAEALAAIHSDPDQANVPVRTVRFFNVYGPGLSARDYRVMSRFALAAIGGEQIQVFGYGHQTRSYCYVTDALTGTLLVLLHGDGRPFNVGNDLEELSVRDLANVFADAVKGTRIESVTPPAEYQAEPNRRCPDLTRLRGLGYSPEVGIRLGVRRFLDWAETAPGYKLHRQ